MIDCNEAILTRKLKIPECFDPNSKLGLLFWSGLLDKPIDSFKVIDGRDSLPRHKIKKWSIRRPEHLAGAVYHQSLDNYGTAKGNANYHVKPNHISNKGLPGLSYTFFVEKSGDIILANDIECITYSLGDPSSNRKYISVCFGGNFSAPGYIGPQEPTKEQICSGAFLWLHLKSIFGFANSELFGHYYFGKKSCPGHRVAELIDKINMITDDSGYNFNISMFDRQRALKKLGFYGGSVDSIWGNKSKTALINFQREHFIIVDGVWGRQTTTAIIRALDELDHARGVDRIP